LIDMKIFHIHRFMLLRKVFLFVLIELFSIIKMEAQQDPNTVKLLSFVKNINTFNRQFPQEKTYLHFDNTGYFVGEFIWFKAYVVRADNHHLTELSKILYVELVSPEGFVVESRKLKIENGQCHGEFLLKDSLFAGFYEIRAYTANMLNFGNDGIFSRVFPVYDKPLQAGNFNTKTMRERPRILGPSNADRKIKEKIEMTFFPEGGNLIHGLQSKVAFKIVNERGENVEISGYILDDKGNQATTFSTFYKGAGYFLFTPDGKKYTANILYNNKNYKFALPEEIHEGFVMNIGNLRNEFIDVKIEKSQNLAAQPIGLSVSCRGKAYLFLSIRVDSTNCFELNIPKKELPSGVNQITLFNTNGEVLSERLVFVNHPDDNRLSFQVTKNSQVYQPYKPVELKFQISDSKGLPAKTVFSLAVRDEDTEDYTGDVGNIMTNLLLSSDIKGYIEAPSSYFNQEDTQKNLKLELLMMTQGWRRYSWREEAGLDGFELKNPIEKGLFIDGSIVSCKGMDLLTCNDERNVEVFAEIKSDSLIFIDSCRTDEKCRFRFALNDFHGKVDLKLLVKQKIENKNIFIPLKRIFPPDSRTYSHYETVLTDDLQVKHSDTISSMNGKKGRQLREVTVTARKRTRYHIDYSKPILCLNYQDQIDFQIDNGEYYMMLDQLVECLYVNLGKRGIIDGSIFPMIDLKVIDLEYGGFLPWERIESITIYRDMEIRMLYADFNNDVPSTVISFNSYKNGYRRPKGGSGLRYTTLQGYSVVKEFYSPNYENMFLPDVKDFRRTLYWNPDVNTDSTGAAIVHFYNNSNCKSIKISAETVTKDGEIGEILQ